MGGRTWSFEASGHSASALAKQSAAVCRRPCRACKRKGESCSMLTHLYGLSTSTHRNTRLTPCQRRFTHAANHMIDKPSMDACGQHGGVLGQCLLSGTWIRHFLMA